MHVPRKTPSVSLLPTPCALLATVHIPARICPGLGSESRICSWGSRSCLKDSKRQYRIPRFSRLAYLPCTIEYPFNVLLEPFPVRFLAIHEQLWRSFASVIAIAKNAALRPRQTVGSPTWSPFLIFSASGYRADINASTAHEVLTTWLSSCWTYGCWLAKTRSRARMQTTRHLQCRRGSWKPIAGLESTDAAAGLVWPLDSFRSECDCDGDSRLASVQKNAIDSCSGHDQN